MDNTDELKVAAAPKQTELTAAINELKDEQIITNNLLSRLCSLHEDPDDNDKSLLKKLYDVELCRKRKDAESRKSGGRKALLALLIAILMFGLEITRGGMISAFAKGLLT